MSNWIRLETFKELEVVEKQLFYLPERLNKDLVNSRLNPSLHLELYDFFGSGGEVLFRPNQDGEIELHTLINDVDPLVLAKSKFGIDNVKIDTNRFEFQFLIFDREDDPLRLPFIFELHDDVQRYCAAALCEQRDIPFYFLLSDEESLKVSFCKTISWPNEFRESFRGYMREAYQRNVNVDSISASEISQEELASSGWAYQFDLNILEGLLGSPEDVNSLMRKIISECFHLISQSKYKGVNKGPFLVWMFQRKGIYGASGDEQEAIILIISPFYNDRSPRVAKEIEPCYEFLQSLEGFIRVESGNPIFENALPLFRYDNGTIQRVELDGAFLETAATLQDNLLSFSQIYRGDHINIYRYLLENR